MDRVETYQMMIQNWVFFLCGGHKSNWEEEEEERATAEENEGSKAKQREGGKRERERRERKGKKGVKSWTLSWFYCFKKVGAVLLLGEREGGALLVG